MIDGKTGVGRSIPVRTRSHTLLARDPEAWFGIAVNGAVVLTCLWTFLADQHWGDFGTPLAVLSLFILWPSVGIAWLAWVFLSLRAYARRVRLRTVASWAVAPTLLVLTGALVWAMPDPLEAAADRIRARGDPRIAAVDFYHDWLDGDRLSVTLVPAADHADARAVGCGVVLAAGVPRSVGIWVRTDDGRVGWRPTDRECSSSEPVSGRPTATRADQLVMSVGRTATSASATRTSPSTSTSR